MSKGSNRRPASVPQETFAERWGRAFGRQCEHVTGTVHRLYGLTVEYVCSDCGEIVAGSPGPDWRNWKGGILTGVTWADPETKEEG